MGSAPERCDPGERGREGERGLRPPPERCGLGGEGAEPRGRGVVSHAPRGCGPASADAGGEMTNGRNDQWRNGDGGWRNGNAWDNRGEEPSVGDPPRLG